MVFVRKTLAIFVIAIAVAVGSIGGIFAAKFMNYYVDRGFAVMDAARMATEDVKGMLHIGEKDKEEEEKDWYPMANANVSWNLLWRAK